MATVLIAGNTALFTQETLERIAEDNMVVLAGSEAGYEGKLRGIHVYRMTPMEDSFGQLFDVYTFNAVWYVSGYADGGDGTFGEVQMLEQEIAGTERQIKLAGERIFQWCVLRHFFCF